MKTVKQIRKICRVTQVQMAEMLGMEQGNYCNLENGKLILNSLPVIKKKAIAVLLPKLHDIISLKTNELNELIELEQGNTQQKKQPRISIDTIWETVLYWVSDPAIVLNNEKRSKEYLNALLEEYANQFRSQVTTRDLQEIDRAREER